MPEIDYEDASRGADSGRSGPVALRDGQTEEGEGRSSRGEPQRLVSECELGLHEQCSHYGGFAVGGKLSLLRGHQRFSGYWLCECTCHSSCTLQSLADDRGGDGRLWIDRDKWPENCQCPGTQLWAGPA